MSRVQLKKLEMRGSFILVKEIKDENIVWLITKVFRFNGRKPLLYCNDQVYQKIWTY